jgi:hypothetical protein
MSLPRKVHDELLVGLVEGDLAGVAREDLPIIGVGLQARGAAKP